MRKYTFLWCAVGLAACSGTKSGAGQDSLPHDSVTVSGPPAVTVASPSDSIAPAQRTKSAAAATTGGPTTAVTGSASRSSGPPVKTTPIAPPPGAADTVRGIVSVVGTSHEHRVMVAPAGGGRRVEVTGAVAALVGHVAGADVWVAGTRTATSIDASRFIVRTVDGSPAIDGTLKTDGSTLYIVSGDGSRIRIAAPPPPLLGHDGARVWITGDPSRSVASYGFIDPPR